MNIIQRLLTVAGQDNHIAQFPDSITEDMPELIHVGGRMNVNSILNAYARGCFPWTGEAPIPWYSPNPRLVLFPQKFHASTNLRKLARSSRFKIGFDNRFTEVMRLCGQISRRGRHDTWITANMRSTYGELHRLGIAHSVEIFQEDILVGGLYGLGLGKAFFGESMFSLLPNTSKLALFALAQELASRDFHFIDCQQVTHHLISLGATPLLRQDYLTRLKVALSCDEEHGSWQHWRNQKD